MGEFLIDSSIKLRYLTAPSEIVKISLFGGTTNENSAYGFLLLDVMTAIAVGGKVKLRLSVVTIVSELICFETVPDIA